MAAFDLGAILDALSRQGYRPPQPGANQPNPYGVPGGINAITDALTGQGQIPGADPTTSWGYNKSMGRYLPAVYGQMGLGTSNVYSGGMDSAHGQNAVGPPTVRTAPAPAAPPPPRYAPKPGELPRAPAQMWGGGFGLSDNSAWGNKGQATLEQRSGLNGSLQAAPTQPQGHQNYTLPGAGSAFGLGGR